MDDFRVDSISPYDPAHGHEGEDLGKRKRKPHPEGERPEGEGSEIEDIVTLSGQPAQEEEDAGATGYSPRSEENPKS